MVAHSSLRVVVAQNAPDSGDRETSDPHPVTGRGSPCHRHPVSRKMESPGCGSGIDAVVCPALPPVEQPAAEEGHDQVCRRFPDEPPDEPPAVIGPELPDFLALPLDLCRQLTNLLALPLNQSTEGPGHAFARYHASDGEQGGGQSNDDDDTSWRPLTADRGSRPLLTRRSVPRSRAGASPAPPGAVAVREGPQGVFQPTAVAFTAWLNHNASRWTA